MLQALKLPAINHGLYLEVRGADKAGVMEGLRELAGTPDAHGAHFATSVQNKIREKWDGLLADDVLEASFVSNSLDIEGTLAALRHWCEPTRRE